MENDICGADDRIDMRILKGGHEGLGLMREVSMESREEDRQFAVQVLHKVNDKLKNKKAPGDHQMTNETLKTLIEVVPEKLMNMYIRLLKSRCFPAKRRKVKMVLIPKPGKEDYLKAYSHRLINVLGKVYEG